MYGVRWLGLHTESHMRLNTLFATHYELAPVLGNFLHSLTVSKRPVIVLVSYPQGTLRLNG